jgi:acetylornithine deacetylase
MSNVASLEAGGGHFQLVGIETIVFGPGGMAQMHQPHEFIAVTALGGGLGFLVCLLKHTKAPL